MTTVEFLAYLRSLDIQVFAEGERLRCNAPEGVLTPTLRAELTQRKAALLSVLHQAQAPSSEASLPLTPRPRDQALPLSFAQQRLWFLDQLVPENPFYNMPSALRLQGQLNKTALEQALNAIAHRHETLRTSFARVGEQPTQIIAPRLNLSLPVVDLRQLPPPEQAVTIQQLATEEAHRPFNLSVAPLWRVKLLWLAEADYILLLNFHHIISDGWSMGVLLRELGAFYREFIEKFIEEFVEECVEEYVEDERSGDRPVVLPALPVQYADFAAWQRQWLQGEVLDTQLTYWRQQLQDLPLLNLPSDRPRPAVQGYRGATYPLQLSPTITATLTELSQNEGTTLFMTLLAAFQIVLHHYTGQEDIAVGSPIANRNRSEIEGLIGFFVNSLVLRTDLSGNPTFRDLLGRVREVALAAYAHQDLPFEKLVEELHPERDLSRNPLFQVAFALQNAPIEQLALPGLTLTPWQLEVSTTRFDLEFHLWQRSQGLSGLWEQPVEGISGFVAYNTDLFDRATIARLVNHFQLLLERIAASPDARLQDLPILSAAEQHQLLTDWNQTQVDYDRDRCIHQVIEAQAAQTPDAVAVVFQDQHLTYQALNQRANQLAHYIQQQGVQPQSLVGICLDRSLNMIVAMLAVLKAGAAYVPLDPDYPRDRLTFMITDAQLSLLLTQSALRAKISEGVEQVVCLDRDQEKIAQQSLQHPTCPITADHLAYVIYTSGSTGTPKGVMVTHRGLCNVIAAQRQALNLTRESRVLQFSSLSFDASIFEILMAFGVGGTLYIPSPDQRLPGAGLSQFLQHHHITATILPPAVLAALPAADLPALQTVITGGEACSAELVERWANGRRFFNAYGPTEATIWATVAQLQPVDPPTIGRPVANTQVYLLNAYLQPVPIGVVGELYIGGAGVARGYLNRPELTRERFIEHSFAGQPQQATGSLPSITCRLYKTGDLARYGADGRIEFLGRVDDQVKLRGFRIELGEIETVLNHQAAVREAVVTAHSIAHSMGTADKRLIAYVVLNLQDLQVERQVQDEQIQQWRSLYNETYAQSAPHPDPRFNLIGWNSSYTGEAIAPEAMQEWLHYRTAQILAQHPQRVLEIGCGTGLLLFQIAPHCLEYVATDFSQVSLNYIHQQLNQEELQRVRLLNQTADDFTHLDAARFDVVILNSVVQYFPSLDYLMQVLEGALRTVAPGGSIFVGDVRSLPLLTAFHASVQLHQASADLTKLQLQQQVQRSLFEEPELVIDPALFHALRDRFPQISQVEIQLTRGQDHNEMTQFRYNVMVQIAPHSPVLARKDPALKGHHAAETTPVMNWTEALTPALIRQQLIENQPEQLQIMGVPNARVSAAVRTAEWLTNDIAPETTAPETTASEITAPETTAPETVAQLRQALERLPKGIDPEAWWQLETELPYCIKVNESALGCDRYDVTCLRQQPSVKQAHLTALSPTQPGSSRPWQDYTNHPLQNQVARRVIPQLRHALEQQLPHYMIPAAFVVLDALPLTPNGKIDRRALPNPDAVRLEASATPVAARSPLEAKLVYLWAELLGLKQVGIHDNFFELGGHSLLATQLTSRIRDTFGVELPLRHLFEAPTIAQLAPIIDRIKTTQVQPSTPGIVPLARDAHRRLRSTLTNDNQGR